MTLNISVLKEKAAHEKRVAASPDTVKKYTGMGCTVYIETKAGEHASFTDDMYKDAGAKITSSDSEAVKKADILLCVQPPEDSVVSNLKKGAILAGILAPYDNESSLKKWAKDGIITLSMELIPRITRAQAMDVLSSQANLAGYRAVLDASAEFNRAFPMMMTAAGTVPPARVFVMGAGVAGLQAIATAKRLGAIVSATDVRPAAKEQVESLGGTFIAVEDEEFKQAETAGGYAKEMSKEYQAKQQALVEETLLKQDIVITTALIPGRPAPKLISEKMIKSMKPGSVIVDLAVERGGNCAGAQAGKTVEKDGVKIVGHANVPSRLAASAASLYAKNLQNLLGLIIDSEKAALKIDWEDEIIKGITLTKDGKLVHPNFSKADENKSTPAKAEKQGDSKPAAKKTPAKTAAKTTAVKEAPAKKTSVKKPATKKPAASKTATKTATAKKTAPKKATDTSKKKA